MARRVEVSSSGTYMDVGVALAAGVPAKNQEYRVLFTTTRMTLASKV